MELLDALRACVVGGERQVDPAELGELRGQVARGTVEVRHRLAGVDAEKRRHLHILLAGSLLPAQRGLGN